MELAKPIKLKILSEKKTYLGGIQLIGTLGSVYQSVIRIA
jgi:hypothetical protein